jgi:hypothetical protein
MIYVVVRRELWSFGRVATRFLLTTAVLGIAVVWLSILIVSLTSPSPTLHLLVQEYGTALCLSLISVSGVKLTWEATLFRGLLLRQMTPLKRSALLMSGELANIALARFAAGIFGGVLMPLLLLSALHASEEARFVVATSLIFLACLVGEVLERYLFFTACAAPRMPGSIR